MVVRIGFFVRGLDARGIVHVLTAGMLDLGTLSLSMPNGFLSASVIIRRCGSTTSATSSM